MNTKKILLSPATILLMATMIVGFFMTISGRSESGVLMMIFAPCVALFICSIRFVSTNWKHIIILFFGTAVMIFVAYIMTPKPDPYSDHTIVLVLESLVILGIGGLIYAFRDKKEKKTEGE